MKPLGVNVALQVVMPSKIEDHICDAVEGAIENGWTPERFRREVASSWQEVMRRNTAEAVRILMGKTY
jgi:hypothetical protein